MTTFFLKKDNTYYPWTNEKIAYWSSGIYLGARTSLISFSNEEANSNYINKLAELFIENLIHAKFEGLVPFVNVKEEWAIAREFMFDNENGLQNM